MIETIYEMSHDLVVGIYYMVGGSFLMFGTYAVPKINTKWVSRIGIIVAVLLSQYQLPEWRLAAYAAFILGFILVGFFTQDDELENGMIVNCIISIGLLCINKGSLMSS